MLIFIEHFTVLNAYNTCLFTVSHGYFNLNQIDIFNKNNIISLVLKYDFIYLQDVIKECPYFDYNFCHAIEGTYLYIMFTLQFKLYIRHSVSTYFIFYENSTLIYGNL